MRRTPYAKNPNLTINEAEALLLYFADRSVIRSHRKPINSAIQKISAAIKAGKKSGGGYGFRSQV